MNTNVTLLICTYIVFPKYEHINIHEEKLEGTESYKGGEVTHTPAIQRHTKTMIVNFFFEFSSNILSICVCM